MKTKQMLSILLSVLMMMTSFPVTALATADEAHYTEDGTLISYRLQQPDGKSDMQGVGTSAYGNKVEWSYTAETKTLNIDTVAWGGTIDDPEIPTYMDYFRIYSIDQFKTEHPEDYAAYLEDGYTDEQMEQELLETVTDTYGTEYRGYYDTYWLCFDDVIDILHIGERVRYINAMGLYDCDHLETVTFEEEGNLSYLGNIFQMSTVKTVTFPFYLDSIQDYMFSNSQIEYVDMSQTNIKVIPAYCFRGAKKLQTLKLNNKITKIQNYAFTESSLSDITLPDSVKEINGYAFSKANIAKIDLSHTEVTAIRAYTFFNCPLREVKLNPNTTLIDAYAFSGTDISEIDIPSSVTTIGDHAFGGTKNLTSIKLTNTESLGEYAFYNSGVKKVDLSQTKLTAIRSHAFGHTNIDEILMPDNGTTYWLGIQAFSGSTINNFDLVNCNKISKESFSICTIKNLVLHNSGMSLNTASFTRATVEYVRMDDGYCPVFDTTKLKTVVNLGHNAQLYAQTELDPEQVTVYGYTDTELYEYCLQNNIRFYSLDEHVAYPMNAEEAEGGIEIDVTALTNSQFGTFSCGTWEAKGKTMHFYGNGDMTSTVITDNNGTDYTVAEYVTANGITKINLHDGITALPNNFLYVNENTRVDIQSVYLPYDLRIIGENAFRNTNLEVLISQAFVYIEDRLPTSNVFKNAEVWVLPEHIHTIGKYAFAGTKGLNTFSVMMPSDLNIISEGLFYGSNVKVVAFESNKATKIEKKAFSDCPKLVSLQLSYNITDIYEDTTFETVTTEYDGGEVETENVYHRENNAFGFLANGRKSNNYLTVTVAQTESENALEAYCRKYNISVQYSTASNMHGTIKTSASGNYFDWNYYDNTDSVTLSLNTKNDTVIWDGTGTVGNIYENSLMAKNRDEETAVTKRINYFDGFDSLPAVGNSPYAQNEDISSHPLDVEKVVVEDGVERICASDVFAAFNPREIELPETLTHLDYNVFGNCTRLEGLVLPDSLISIGEKIFYNCPNLKYIKFGSGIKEIPSKVLYNVKSLRFIEIGENVEIIHSQAFYNCTALEEIVIPDKVHTINQEAFYNCINAQTITIGKNVKWVADNAFSNSLYCENIIINSGGIVSSDLGSAFKDVGLYTNGVTITYGDAVSSIDMRLIKYLKAKTLSIGKGVRYVRFLQYTPKTIEKIELAEDNPYFTMKNGLLYNGTYLHLAPRNIKTATIAPDTTAVGEYAFYGSKLTTVSIPRTTYYIHSHAFANCADLKTVSLGKGVNVIFDSAFENDTSLRLVYFPDNIMRIDDYAFRNCSELANITFVFDSTNLGSIGKGAFFNCKALKNVVFPQNLREIDNLAFYGCSSLENAYIWNTDVGENTFVKNMVDKDTEFTIHTMAGSPAHGIARTKKIPFHAFTDEDAFLEECAIKLDELAGYLGYCENGHGNIEYLTVYEADCENEGYVIGVCEFCSEILEEVHTPARGHSKQQVIHVDATQTTRGFTVERCSNCGEEFCNYEAAIGENIQIETHTISGRVTVAQNSSGIATSCPVANVKISINGMVMTTTDGAGRFTLTLETGTYEAKLKYDYGLTRTIYLVVEDEDIELTDPIAMIACDFNKDGKINSEDMKLFTMVISSCEDDVSYLRFVDLNNDGYINGKDQAYIRGCLGIDSASFEYVPVVIKK